MIISSVVNIIEIGQIGLRVVQMERRKFELAISAEFKRARQRLGGTNGGSTNSIACCPAEKEGNCILGATAVPNGASLVDHQVEFPSSARAEIPPGYQ